MFDGIKKRFNAFQKANIIKSASSTYNVTEHNGELWITFNGRVIFPVEMLWEKNAIKALEKLRSVYISNALREGGLDDGE